MRYVIPHMTTPIYILQGVSGSGKSSIAKKLADEQDICSADDYFTHNGVYRFDPSKLGEAHGSCLRKYVSLLLVNAQKGRPIVVDNTNTTVGEIAPYYSLAEAYGYRPVILTVECDPEVAANRNTHGVPLEACKGMAARIEATKSQLPPWWRRVSSEDAAKELTK